MSLARKEQIIAKRISLSLAIAVLVAFALPSGGTAQVGSDTCQADFVARDAVPGDRVCVTPAVRQQVQRDNAEAAAHAGENAFGQPACKDGFEFRAITPDDKVCVTAEMRGQIVADNALADARRAAPGAQPAPAPIGPQAILLMRGAFQNWARTNGVNATMMVYLNGQTVGNVSSAGNVFHSDMILPVASLSKAITAACVMELIASRPTNVIINLQSTIAQVMPTFARNFPTGQGSVNVNSIRVEHLLRHQSGLRFDPTQDAATFKMISGQTNPDEGFATQTLNGATVAVAQSYFYNNVNYAILGMMIRTVSGQSYETYCKRVLLTPRGAPTARLGDGTGKGGVWAMGAFGGWEITAREYIAFYYSSLRGPTRIGTDFMITSPSVDMNMLPSDQARCPGCNYGLGVIVRPIGAARLSPTTRYNIWHYGDWDSAASGTVPSTFAAYAASWTNGYTVVVIYDRVIPGAARLQLDFDLFAAANRRDTP